MEEAGSHKATYDCAISPGVSLTKNNHFHIFELLGSNRVSDCLDFKMSDHQHELYLL
jgi:hypothetical protein